MADDNVSLDAFVAGSDNEHIDGYEDESNILCVSDSDDVAQSNNVYSVDRSSTDASDNQEEQTNKEKKKKKKKKKGKSVIHRDDLASFSAQDTCEYLNKKLTTVYSTLTPLEISGMQLLPEMIFDIKDSNESQFSRILQNLPEHDRLMKSKKCSVLILSSAALRSLEVMRELLKSKCKGRIAKLFAKHMKAKEQISVLRSGKGTVSVGTPARIVAISDADSSLFSSLEYVIVDVARDVKERNIFEIPETCKPTVDLIFKTFAERIRTGKLRVIFAFS